MSMWYANWFNSPYYHILYKHRDSKEAERFLELLIQKLPMKENATVLDVACGKGRHSLYLNKKGFDVCGFDLSGENIRYCKTFENDRLHFYTHDMRDIFRVNYFDYVLSLFSSFGYFESDHDNYRVIWADSVALNKNGILVIDYFNTQKVCDALPAESEPEIDGIRFHIRKYLQPPYVKKEIRFSDKGKDYQFEESVRLYTLDEFEVFFRKAKLKLQSVYGNYQMDPFSASSSDRLIMAVSKIR